jgi:hypothetical protein
MTDPKIDRPHIPEYGVPTSVKGTLTSFPTDATRDRS